MDRNFDGVPDGGDEALAGVQIEPLSGFESDGRGTISYGPDPNADSTVTAANGTFFLTHRADPLFAGIAVGILAPPEETAAVRGRLTRIFAVEMGTARNPVAIPSRPLACADAADCDQLALPDLQPITTWDQVEPGVRSQLQAVSAEPPNTGLLPPETWHIEDADDGRRLLRFSSVTANVGAGPLHIIADRDAHVAGRISTWQRIWTTSWNYLDQQSGYFIFHDGHDHIHFDAFERYRLLNAAGQVVAESAKVSFCLRDSVRIWDEPAPTIGPLGSAGQCGASEQSINAGSADHYDQFLPDQWIDVTGVAPGDYIVEITVDPEGAIRELDESNNEARFPVVIPE